MRILVIEDEVKIAAAIKRGLEQEAYAVDVAHTAIEGYDLASSEAYDTIILDRMLPGEDGMVLCQRLRTQRIHTPILMLTAKGQIEDRVEGLNSGADDYLVKPFSFTELVARVRALQRRPQVAVSEVLEVEDLSLNTTTFEVKRAGRTIHLSQKEYSLLEYLMRHVNQTLTKEQIMEHVWNYAADVLPNTVEVYIGYLRQKIDKSFAKSLIHTIRGFGYRIGEMS